MLKRITLAVTFFFLGCSAVAKPPEFARSPAVDLLDFRISGEAVDVGEIPSSGGAWYITVRRLIPGDGQSDEYLTLICDREQAVTEECQGIGLFDQVDAAGYIRSNEPQTGQRLSVRSLRITTRLAAPRSRNRKQN